MSVSIVAELWRAPMLHGMRFAMALLFVAMMLPPLPASAGSETEASGAETVGAPLELDVILDARLSRERRAGALARLEAAARGGDGDAQYVLGALYRLGERHPARLVEFDPDKADLYLGNAAIRGQVTAMAGLAELHLRQGNGHEAIVWAYLFIHYDDVRSSMARDKRQGNRGYAASLIRRCRERFDENEELARQVTIEVAAFIERHDQAIREGLVSPRSDDERSLGPARLPPRDPLRFDTLSDRILEPAQAEYLIGVDGRGHVSRVFVIESLPTTAAARAMRQRAVKLQFAASQPRAPLRWIRAPFRYDDHSIRLVTEE